MNCVECGFEIPPGSRFCGRCGMTLPPPDETRAASISGDASQTLVPAGATTTATLERPSAITQRVEAPTPGAEPARTVRLPEAGPETVEIAATAPPPPARDVPTLPSCPQCGYLLQPEARFCNGCGYLVAPATPEWKPAPAAVFGAAEGRKRWPVLVALGRAVAVAIVGGFVLFNSLAGGGGQDKARTSTPTATPIGGAIGGAGSGSTPTATPSQSATASVPATEAPSTQPTTAPTVAPPTVAPTLPVVIPPTSTKVPVLPTNTPVPPPPTPLPTATPTPIPFSAFTFAAAIDAYSYNVGDTGTLCYLMDPENVPYYVVVTQTAPYTMQLGEWEDDGIGGGDCTTFPIIADDRPGIRLQIDAYVAGGVLTVQLSATVY